MSNKFNLKWVAAQLKPNMISKVENELNNQSIEFFAPRRQETVRYGKFFRKIHRLLFPGYIFVRIDPNSRDVSSLNSTFGISRLVKRGDKKVGILPDDFVQNLINIQGKVAEDKNKNFFPGKNIKWIDGPFSGEIGEILKVDQNGRLKVLFEILDGYRIVSADKNKLQVIN